MSKKKDAEGNEIVEFDTLDLEEESKDAPSKLDVLKFLEDKLEPTDLADLKTKLGLEEDISNAELLEKFTELIAELKGEEEKEKPEGEEEKEMMDRKEFIKKCMEEGKDMATCSEEFKKKYPEPKEKEEADTDELGKEDESEMSKRLTDLEGKYAALLKEKDLAGISAKVDELVKDKHLAPVQRAQAIKLAAALDEEQQEGLLDFFRTTQKISVHTDVGHMISGRPGEDGGTEITADRRKELIKLHGLDGLIDDKADKSKLPWERNN